MSPGAAGSVWLVAIDLQRVFAEPESPWCAPGFRTALDGTLRLARAFHPYVASTRFLPPTEPSGAWRPYFAQWPFALEPAHASLFDFVPEYAVGHGVVVDRSSFGKWDAAMQASLVGVREIVLTGVSTDCCVLSTALGAIDAGIGVQVAADACVGVTDASHRQALAVMSLYAPLIRITSVDDVLARVGHDGTAVAP